MKKCPRCGLPNKGIKECEYCGLVFKKKPEPQEPPPLKESKEAALKTCHACEAQISKNVKSCPHCGEPQKKSRKKLILVGIIGFIFLYTFINTLSNDQGSKRSYKREKKSNVSKKSSYNKPMEYTLAYLDADGSISEDHISVSRCRSLLQQLSSTYDADQDRIGNATVAMQNELKKVGVSVKIITLLEGMNQIYTNRKANQTYEQCGAAYIIARKKGSSHTQTIRGLREFLNK